MRPLRVVLIGCVASSEAALRALHGLEPDRVRLVGLITRRASGFNSDFVDLLPLVQGRELPILYADLTEAPDQTRWIAACQPDLVFVVGWSQLLKKDMLEVALLGTIGFHPAALPANRGRHPLVWALALGLDETASSFFLMGEGADDGPLLSQYPVVIEPEDTAQSLYTKILDMIPRQITEIVEGLQHGLLHPEPQDENHASYWRKRSEIDGRIDWRMPARGIYNLIRALARPYPGAEMMVQEGAVKVWCCALEPAAPANAEPGKVLAVEGRSIVVKTGDGAVRLLEHELLKLPSAGDYL
jgi:methionyl-tRNA formyltransferase